MKKYEVTYSYNRIEYSCVVEGIDFNTAVFEFRRMYDLQYDEMLAIKLLRNE